MPIHSLSVEHLKKTYPQLTEENPSEYYERLHYHARKLKLVQIRATLELMDDYFSSELHNIKTIIRDLTDLVEDLI